MNDASRTTHATAVWSAIVTVALALAGLAISGVLLHRHITIEVGGDPLFSYICTAGDNADCDEVLASAWGELFGRPAALWGLGFYALIAAWFIVFGGASPQPRFWPIIPILLNAAGTAWCAFLDYQMFFQLDAWCPLCFSLHVLTLILLILSIFHWRARRRVAPPWPGTRAAEWAMARHFVMAVLLAATTTVAAGALYHYEIQRVYAEGFRKRWDTYASKYRAQYEEFLVLEQRDIPIHPDDPVRGPADAEHTVVVFTDFQCPFCKALAEMIDERREQFPGQFKVVFKHFPMNTKCNEFISVDLHAGSCATSRVAEVTRIVGGNDAFWQMHDALFENQKEFGTEWVKETAGRIGVDTPEFWAQFKRYSSWDQIYRHVREGHELGVKGTPALFFDGRKLERWGDVHTWRFLLEMEPTETDRAAPPSPPAEPQTEPGEQELATQPAN